MSDLVPDTQEYQLQGFDEDMSVSLNLSPPLYPGGGTAIRSC